jgi:hypothetical protein
MATLRNEVLKLRQSLPMQVTLSPMLKDLAADPAAILTRAGMTADPWQQTCLRCSHDRILLLCSRQVGKSTTAAALALKAALLTAGALVLLLSPTERQSKELLRKVAALYRALGRPIPLARSKDSTLQIELANGSRIIALPGNEATTRGYSGAQLVVLDEAARVPDDLYFAVRPMLATSGGQLVCLSSAYAKQGFFYIEWTGSNRWHRVKVRADECPRISAEFLAEERRALGDRWYAMEYEGEFGDAIDAVFSHRDIMQACLDAPPPLELNL